MEIRIARRCFHERFQLENGTNRYKRIKIYLIIVDGRRVDSFMLYRNAVRKAKSLRANGS